MKNDMQNIDLVYLWVDGSDPDWLAKRNAFIGNTEENTSVNCKGRYADNDELKYSLRSVEKHAPWIRKIFIVTDNQTPDWLDTENPKIAIIDHKDIMPQNSLPCFNPMLIEHFLHKIPDLSEYFVYANDDMFINKTISPDVFFAVDGLPIIRINQKPFRRFRWLLRQRIFKKPLGQYSKAISNAAVLMKRNYGIHYDGVPHHNIDAYLKSDHQRVAEQTFKNEFEAVFTNQKRSYTDISRVIYSYVALAEKRGHFRAASKKESLHVQIHKKDHYKKIEKYNPTLFCMNDSQHAQDSDRMRAKEFLNKRFPEKSTFEK